MLQHRTHVQLTTFQRKKFLMLKTNILTVTERDTPENWADKLKQKKVTSIVTKQKDDKDQFVQLLVLNSISSLKKLLA